MPREGFERYIQPLYLSISQLLSGDIERGKKSILKIIEECRASGICEERFCDEMIHLSNIIEAYAKGVVDESSLANCLYKELTLGKDLSDIAILVTREVCNEKFMEVISKWSDDPEPVVRTAYLKCLMKLYDRGAVGLEEISKFVLDPSPMVRDVLISLLAPHTNRKEVISIFMRMLNRERKSSIRSKILNILSESLEENRKNKK